MKSAFKFDTSALFLPQSARAIETPRLLAVCAVLLAAWPACAAETRSSAELWRTGSNVFRDGIYNVAERQSRELLMAYPRFPNTEDATLLLGEALVLSG